ncbi:MAG: glycosyltransferase family 4 protein [Dickeya sp.]|uniref:Glycosyl transferase group 1 n=1 Tax=Dickeya zeae (strain Ech586) TaxID=590409 RepID=D2BSD7_DICZ5|nr:glycosyltransferase family 4 protein [Dickeya parazeae]ACZ75556.1 glycosyl transferase group 1 [Dickeya parazeae Ech586]PXW46876.1 glycosyltransferase involved in cell wall biosynthesis [Erwinia sp. AG740]
MILRVLSFFIRYGDADYKGAYQELMEFYAGMPDIEVESVLIDTALESGVEARLGTCALMMAGDNNRREFSGWDSALGRYRDLLADFDLVHLVTSAFQNEYNGFYPLICREMLEYVRNTPHVMLAHIDAYPERVHLLGRGFQTWGCSKFLFARPVDLAALGSLVGPFSGDDFFPSDNSTPFRTEAPLSQNYADFLLNWLTGDGLPHGKWHSVFRYTDNNIAKFRAKALSILDEHNLSMRIRESGVRIVDYTWWHAKQDHLEELIPPDELTQVKERNQYLFGTHIVNGESPQQLPLPARPRIAALLEGNSVGGSLFSGELIDALISGLDVPDEWSSMNRELTRAALLMKAGYRFCSSQIDWLRQTSDSFEQHSVLPISIGLHAIWLARDDLRQNIDLRTQEGRENLIVWWWREGRTETWLRELIPEAILSEPDHSLVQDAPLPITCGLHVVWLAREDLRQTLDLETLEGRQDLVIWWWREGRADAWLRALIPEAILSEPDHSLVQDAPLPITRGLHTLWLIREDLQEAFDLDTPQGRIGLTVWWFVEKVKDANISYLIADSVLDEIAPCFSLDSSHPFTRGEYVLWLSRADLRNAFDIKLPEGRQAYHRWMATFGCTKDYILQSQYNRGIQQSKVPTSGYIEGGINIVGYGRGEFGIGEDVRMAVKAFSASSLDVCVPILPLSVSARQEDRAIRGYEVAKPVFRTNLICLPYYETLRLLAATHHDIFDCRYNIAFWQWELSRFPESMRCALDFVDEIWASSEFTASAIRDATDKPVFHMPMVVSLPHSTQQWKRADFGLPENDFIFLTVLDGNSSLKRKNPLAAVQAFSLAFPYEKDVRLVIKAMNVSESQPHWRNIVDLAAKDERIYLIVETFSKDKLIGLQSVCDSFVSLHRSEGFGRNIAEAMLLGKPVIVSDYSGNRDFTTSDTAFLVQGSMVPVAHEDYAFAKGQIWFEPDVDMAVGMFKVCRENEDLRRTKAIAGKEFVSRTFSSESVGASYKKRIDTLTAI